jgi:hypothetical protein
VIDLDVAHGPVPVVCEGCASPLNTHLERVAVLHGDADTYGKPHALAVVLPNGGRNGPPRVDTQAEASPLLDQGNRGHVVAVGVSCE